MKPNTILHRLAQLSGKPRAAPEFQNLAAAAAAVTGPDSVKHYIVAGRIPGDDEDTIEHVTCGPGEDPWVAFVEQVLYDDVVPTEDYEAERDRRPHAKLLPSDW